MLKNFLLSNFRTLWKNRTHTFINLAGLALGITCSVLIFLIVKFELSFDSHHTQKEKIYRVVTEYFKEQPSGFGSGMTYPFPPALRNDFADLKYVALVDANMSPPVITIPDANGKDRKFKEKKAAFVDPEYLKMFDHEWILGNNEALSREKTVVISESTAKKYFGNESPMNKVITFNNEFDVTVTGVIKDPPLNTDFPFHVLLSSKLGADKRGWEDWGATASSLNCYVLLGDQVSKEAFEAKLKGWHLKYFKGNNEEDGKFRTYFLQPLKEIHTDTRFGNFNQRVVSKESLFTLLLIGLLLLATACINFINLNTVLIVNRSKETGIRKVMGSTRGQLVFQFLAETALITVIALLISSGLVELSLIYLEPILEYKLSFDPLTDPLTLLFVLALPIVVTILAGLYPAISLSQFQPVQALKNKLAGKPGQGMTLRRGLIVFQLMISQALVVCTIIAVQQINHFMTQPLGINSEAVIEFNVPENKPETIHRLTEQLTNLPSVANVSLSNTGSTSGNQWSGDFEATVKGNLIKEQAQVKFADANYVSTYGIRLLHGENLPDSDTVNRFLVNVAFTKELGYDNPEDALGTEVNLWGNKAIVKGIVNDFHSTSLHQDKGPVIITTSASAYYIGAVRLATNSREAIAQVQKVWEEVYPKYVFEYTFLDETIEQFYKAERRNSYLIGIFAGVAILIGCIGLFGLISFMAKNKTKEVGIRKTLGASVGQVVALFSKEFIVLVAISFVLSAPLSYYFMNEWLKNFAYRITPGVMTFLLGIGVSLLVVFATVGIKSYRAAVANPVDALRDE
jgi:putative ABC transport system permease protein